MTPNSKSGGLPGSLRWRIGILCHLPVIVLLLSLTGLVADTVILKNGRKVEGTIVGQNRKQIRIRVGRRVRTISKGRIRRIRYQSAEEAKALAEQKKRAEEKRRKAALRRRREAERRRAEQKRKAEETRRQAEQKRKAEEARLQAEQKRKEEQERQAADQKRKAEEERRRLEQERKQSEEARRAETERQRQEAERKRQGEQKQLAAEREREAAHARLLQSLASYHIALYGGAGGGRYAPFVSLQLPKFAIATTLVQNLMSEGDNAMSFHSEFGEDKQTTLEFGVGLNWNRVFGDLEYHRSKLKPSFGRYDSQNRTTESYTQLGGGGSDSFLREETRFRAGYLFYRHRLFDLGGFGGYMRLKGNSDMGEVMLKDSLSSGVPRKAIDIAIVRSETYLARGPLAGFSALYRSPFKFTLELALYGFRLKGDWFHKQQFLRINSDPGSSDTANSISYNPLIEFRGIEYVLGLRYPFGSSWNARIAITGQKANMTATRYLYYLDNPPDFLMPIYIRFLDSIFGGGATKESFSSITIGVEKRIRFR